MCRACLMPSARLFACQASATSGVVCSISARRWTPGRLIARALIGAYQIMLSPFIGRQCRYLPTCSNYTAEAIERFGLWPGGWIGLARILRCHPWSPSGYDPTPERLDPRYRWWAPWRGARWTGAHLDDGSAAK